MSRDTSIEPLWQVDQRHRRGPFDIIGDVHGCSQELRELLGLMGYHLDGRVWRSSTGRLAVFVGDLADRGPHNLEALDLVMQMVAAGTALCIPGNHDVQLELLLGGEDVPLINGLDRTMAELNAAPAAVTSGVLQFLRGLPGHVVLDVGRLVVAHTGLAAEWHGVATRVARRLAAYGVAEGEPDPSDVSKRHAWVASYAGPAVVVYGHTAVTDAVWRGPTIDIDTGCVFGGRLTALQWPERTLVSVHAHEAYATTRRGLIAV